MNKKMKMNIAVLGASLLLGAFAFMAVPKEVQAADTTTIDKMEDPKQTAGTTNGFTVNWAQVTAPSSTNGGTTNAKDSSKPSWDDIGNLIPDTGSDTTIKLNQVYYHVSYCEKGVTNVNPVEVDTATNSYTVSSGLKAGSSYEVWVSAWRYVATGSTDDNNKTEIKKETIKYASNHVEVVTAPDTYADFSYKQTKTDTTSATVTFSEVPGANRYEVQYKAKDMPSFRSISTGKNKNTVTLKKISKNTRVDITISANRESSTGFVAKSSKTYSGVVVLKPSKPGISKIRINKSYGEINIYPKDNSERYRDGFQYQIYRVSDKKQIAKKKSTKGSYYTYSNNAFGKRELFKVRARAYKVTQDGSTIYSDWSSWAYASEPGFFKNVKVKGSKGIQVNWSKVNGASGYKVYASTKNDWSTAKVVSTVTKGKTTSTTFKKVKNSSLKKNKRYYVWVRPYYKDGKNQCMVKNYDNKPKSVIYK